MSAIQISPTESAATAASVVIAAYGRSSTGGAAVALDYADPFIEAPIEFVPGVEARPSREPQDEPAGSGPFGF
jgi:hypothetical protein